MTSPTETKIEKPGYFAQALDRLYAAKSTVAGAIAAKTPERISNMVKKIQESSIAKSIEPWGITSGSAIGLLSTYAGVSFYNGAPIQAGAILFTAFLVTEREHFYPIVFNTVQTSFAMLAYANLNSSWNQGVEATLIQTEINTKEL